MNHLPLNLPGSVYASAMPFSSRDLLQTLFDEYGYHAIHTVVLLTSEAETVYHTGRNLRQFYLQKGLKVIYLPVEDFSTPDQTALNQAVDAALAEAQAGRNIVIHCYYGRGRTGTFGACLARKALGMNGVDALNWIRSHIEGAVENDAQEAVVMRFGAAG
jgi:protein-tyrosine phosphatase